MNLTKQRKSPTAKVLLLVFWLCTQLCASAQQATTVTGTVTDETGEPLSGVSVRLNGTETGTITNDAGGFSLVVPNAQGTLSFSSVGFTTLEVPVNGQSRLTVVLKGEPSSLNEVVVIGYGSQKREMVTSSIATVKAEDFNSGQIADPLTLIAGKVPGLAITRPSGADPNAGADFSLRGPATIEGNSQPLIVIDGVPGGDLQTIAPADIASIDILKDGSAAAIYGSRATAGVIIVTTKRGTAGKTTVSYNGNFSMDQIFQRYEMLTADQYVELAEREGLSLDDRGAQTNWFDEVTRTPASQSHNLSLSGGSEKTTYYASVNYRDLQGMDRSTEREFVNATLRLRSKAINDKLDLSVMLTNTFDTKSYANYGAIAQSLNMNPTYPVRNADGTFFENPDIPYQLQWNPVANMHNNINENKEKRLLGSVNLNYDILSTLRASVTYSLAMNDFLSGSYSSNMDFFQQESGVGGRASRSESNHRNNTIEATLSYDNRFDRHGLNVIGGYSYQNIFNEGLSAGNNQFNTNAFLYYNLGAGTALHNMIANANRAGVFVGSYADERTLLAFFGRAIYDYDERYLLNLSIRREGASVLGEDNKWGTFYGVSAGWVLSKENFLAGADFVRNLKLRAGYGVTGNQESLYPYQSLATLGPFLSDAGTQHGYYGEPGNSRWILPYGPTINANPDLRWETKKETNVGIDFTLFESGWLNGSIDYYHRKIEDLVGNYSAQLPSQIFPTIFANAGVMTNEGVEVALNAQVFETGKFSWNVGFTGAYNENQIVSVTSDQFKGTAHNITDVGVGPIQRLAPGHAVAVFYGRVFAGFTEDGHWLFKNSAGETVTANEIGDNDFAYLGNSIPKYNLGLVNNFNVGRFDASVLLRSALGFHAVNAKRMFHENLNNFSTMNLFASVLESEGIRGEQYFSSYYIERGNYLKLDNLTIGYTLPIKANNYLQNIRLYATGTNLFAITGFSGMDPELGLSFDTNPSEEFTSGPGVEPNYSYYPTSRTYTLGISANF